MIRLAAACSLLALLLAACGSSDDPPPRSPLDDTSTPAPTASSPSATSSPVASVTTTPDASSTPDGDAADVPDDRALEAFTGNAIELMAEWLGVPFTDISVGSAEALIWPNACIGIEQPGVACAEILTPGFKVVLFDAFDGPHTVHGSTRGDVRWAGEETASGVITSVQGTSITVEAEDGQRVFLATPGTAVEGPDGLLGLADVEAGLEVAVAFDGSPTGSALPVLAWLLVTSGS